MENYDETVEFVKSANEGFFNKFKPKVKSDDAINEVIHPPKLQPIDKKLLTNATFSVPIYPYQSNYMSSNDEKAYKALQGKLRPAVSKAILKVQSISKKYDCTNYTTYFNNVFSEFSKSYEWKTIGNIMIDIQKFEYKYGGIELDDYNILTDWSLINTEDYTDAVLYDFDLASCDQDQFFIFDNIIACLFAAASKKIPNSYANCFADDNAVFTLIIKRNEPVTEGLFRKKEPAKLPEGMALKEALTKFITAKKYYPQNATDAVLQKTVANAPHQKNQYMSFTFVPHSITIDACKWPVWYVAIENDKDHSINDLMFYPARDCKSYSWKQFCDEVAKLK